MWIKARGRGLRTPFIGFPLDKSVQKFLRWVSLLGGPFANRLLARSRFVEKHGRRPLPTSSPRAVFEDYIFARMTGPWTPFEEQCVDKESAKEIAARLSPGLKSAPTRSVLPLGPGAALERVGRFLHPFIGQNLVAKPTHASGGIVFLGLPDPGTIARQTFRMFRLAGRNFFLQEYESQYRRLAPKIIVEECLSSGPASLKNGEVCQPPADYRFYSSRGRVLFCQYDEGRFTDHRQALFTVPGYRHISIADIYPLPNPLPERPAHWDGMVQAASDLSRPFYFVRVDLYDLPDGVYFSEFTFTPNAGLFPFRNPGFSRKLLEDVLRAPPGEGDDAPNDKDGS